MDAPPTRPPPAPSAASLVGQVLGGRYRIVHPIARGGMGMVYEASDEKLGRSVAIKVLLPELAQDPTCRERFAREAHAVARTSHPSLVAIHDLVLDGTPAYFVLELIDGQSLGELIAVEGRLSWPRASRLVIQVLDALQCLHDAGVVHRDLKPSNVLVVGTGSAEHAKVIDLGVAQLATGAAYQRLTASGAIVGTPAYMAPEQLSGERVGPPADLWAVGALFFHALTGQRPFGARELRALLDQVLTTPIADVRAIAPDVPESVARVVRGLCDRVPEKRPSSARAAAEVLREALADGDAKRPDASRPALDRSIAGASAPGRAGDAPTLAAAPAPRAAPSAHTQVLLGSRAASVWAARLAALGIVTTCLVGSGLAALWGLARERDVALSSASASPGTPASAPVAAPGLPAARFLEVVHSGPDAEAARRIVAPGLDPRLRSCVPDLSRHALGVPIAAYNVHVDAAGRPERLVRMMGSAGPEETACIEATLMGAHWPAPAHPPPDTIATVILQPAF